MKQWFSKPSAVFLLRLLTAGLFCLPLLWMCSIAFHPLGNPLPRHLQLLPNGLTLDNFVKVIELIPLGRWTINSLLISSSAVFLTLLTASTTGFAMSQLPQKQQRYWVFLSLAMLLVPGMALWFTRFLLYKWLGFLDTPLALIAPAFMGTSPFYILMFYRAFRRIPAGLYESARLDGANAWQMWWLVALPIARPTAVGVALLSFAVYWGDYNSPLLYINSDDLYTIPVGLQFLQQLTRSEWPLLLAGAVLASALPLILFWAVQPYFARVQQ